MSTDKNNQNQNSYRLFLIIMSSILGAAVIWFIILPVVFNFGSSLITDVFSGEERRDTNFELFNPAAFAYDLGNSWEVNAMINVKGFEQIENEKNNLFEASISFFADLETTDGNIVKDIYSDNVEFSLEEEIIDIPLEVQFELDSTYVTGKYLINLTIEDNYSGGIIKGVIEFDLDE